jgi:hypothetical protein
MKINFKPRATQLLTIVLAMNYGTNVTDILPEIINWERLKGKINYNN